MKNNHEKMQCVDILFNSVGLKALFQGTMSVVTTRHFFAFTQWHFGNVLFDLSKFEICFEDF